MTHLPKNSLEILESRIAPASAIATAQIIPAIVGGPTVLHAGQGLGTAGANSGTYLLYVEQGDALVFTTDFNNNGLVDFNEITGISAGDGLRLTSFVNIYGDIVTNLDANNTLTDSDNDTSNNDPFLKGDGRVLKNNTIEKIELRSLTIDDLSDQNNDGIVDQADIGLRLALSSYSIFGSVYAGKGFGIEGDATSGLIIDDAGRAIQAAEFGTGAGFDLFKDFKPSIGAIKTGTAANGEYFSFGISQRDDTQGLFTTFVPPAGQNGGDIVGVRSVAVEAEPTTFNMGELIAGDGGLSARGGNITDVILNTDTAGGYVVQAGNGGRGPSGGAGGSIVNFQDLGSFTSEVVIRAGDGGAASTGVGGGGGSVSFGTMNVYGRLAITTGSGGDGFTGGGAGASLTKGDITAPEGGSDFTRLIVSSVHDSPHDPVTGRATTTPLIGRSLALDFDRDGFGDMVYTSGEPDQLVVDFGDGLGGFRTPETALPGQLTRMYLGSSSTPDVLTVGDFNGDGFNDIATGSQDAGNFAGILVFLAATEDRDQNGILSDAEDDNGDGIVNLLGFQAPRYSALPTLQRGDPDAGLLFNSQFFFRRSATPITDLEAGDFNGDGFTDLAVTATYVAQDPDQTLTQVLIFMTAELEENLTFFDPANNVRPTGQFYGNFGTKAVSEPPQPTNAFAPFLAFDAGTESAIEATAMSNTDGRDVVVGGAVGSGILYVADNSSPSALGPAVIDRDMPSVDVDRGPGLALVTPTIRELTVHDINSDGNADFTAISETPAGFVVAALGNGTSFSTDLIGGGGNNTGALLFPEVGLLSTNPLVIRNASNDGDGVFDDVVIVFPDVRPFGTFVFEINDVPAGTNSSDQLTLVAGVNRLGVALDIYFIDATSPNAGNYLVGEGATGDPALIRRGPPLYDVVRVTEPAVLITAGSGGDALVGFGGVGGSIGDEIELVTTIDPDTGIITQDIVGSISIVLPQNPNYSGIVDLTGGEGGNGFSFGGKGGSVRGSSVRYASGTGLFHSVVSAFGGDGGFGVAGPGGSGGDLVANSFVTGQLFIAGDGGRGTIGGAGGSILGNEEAGFFDAEDLFITLLAGDGGNGVKLGGVGGNIRNFVGNFDFNFDGFAGGLLSYTAGDGGNAISGSGGRGGDILNSSPLEGVNTLAGNIRQQGGRGGDGRHGGNGGSVRDFTNRPSETDNPAVLAFLAGAGGNATTGRGGKGGDLANINVPSVGKPNIFGSEFESTQPYTFNRFLAGDGGNSAGGKGGKGGAVVNITTSNSDNPFALVSGAGGSGLYKGGTGGSVKDVTVNVGSESFNKGLVIAGAGGSAAAFIPNRFDGTTNQDEKAFGGRVGKAGTGGSIVDFSQTGTIGAKIDLIAGNGGDTINYGTVADRKIFVGKGGSIINAILSGNAGNIDPVIRLNSYNDVLAGETVQEFVQNTLRIEESILPIGPEVISDAVGMVGVVVGSAGRLKEAPTGFGGGGETIFRSQPATNGINGSLIGLSARNIASAVAGAVERLASIQVVSGINITGGGVLGKDFSDAIDPTKYRDPEGNPVPEPVLDGSLVDGALVYQKFKKIAPTDTLPIGRVFQLG